MSSVERVYAVENAMANGLLTSLKWDQSVTYSVSNTSGDYPSGYILSALDGIRPMTSTQRETIYSALDMDQVASPREPFTVEGFTNLDINLVTDGAIKVGSSSNVSGAYAYFPSYSVYGGDVWLGSAGDNPVAGNFDYFAILHELGHALGLKHGHEGTAYDATQVPALNTALPPEYNSIEYSIMTYRTYVGQTSGGYKAEGWGYAQTYMMADIAALQELYGADYTANSGDTVYEWTPTDGTTYINGEAAITPGANRIFLTIWDGGGNDTYDLSAYSSDLEIDLNPGENSEFSTVQLADLRGGTDDNGTLAGGNVYNALMHRGNERSLIENAIGGSGDDLIIGNQAANNLTGGSGDDTFEGGAGNDTINGGAGTDTAIYNGNRAHFQATREADGTVTLADLRPDGTMGQDELRDIEFVQFNDGAVALEGLFPAPEAPENVITFSNQEDISGLHFMGDKGAFTVSENSTAIMLMNNAWKQLATDITISENTVLRFEVEADVEGEIHAIGFQTEMSFRSSQIFQLLGEQKWGNQAYNNLYEAGTGPQSYEIEVGRYFTGDFDSIVFVMDDDADLGGDSTFRNLELYEISENAVPEFALNGQKTDVDISSFGGTHDRGIFSISQNAHSITLMNNAWKQLATDITISDDTVLRFEFEAGTEGEIHGIGFETDNSPSSNRIFQLHGQQIWGIQAYNNLYETGTGPQVYEIEVGQHFTGDFDRIVFVMDDDRALGGNSTFHNIELLEL